MTYFNAQGQGRVGWRSLVVTQVVNAVDADAQAFITAAGITNLTQASAINTLVNDLKTYGLWTKMKALYPMVGGTAAQHRFNLKDPRPIAGAFYLIFNGGWTHSATGVLPNGTTGYADTQLSPRLVLSPSTFNHLSYYSRTNTAVAGEYSIGAYDGAGSLSMILRRDTNNQTFVSDVVGNTYRATFNSSSTDSQAFYVGTQQGTNIKLFRNNILAVSNTSVSNGVNSPTNSIYIGSLNAQGNPAGFFTNKECAFASIGDGLTDTESANFYTSVQKFQTTLGRQIGSPIVSDTDAQAFINAAGLTDLGQANAVNTLVVDLKAAGVWTKMKALYPFVGGTATSHKWNLKDPRDLDAAFRLVFNGGWTHSATGALPNGTTAYADTKLVPSSILTLGSFHHSTYSRTTWSVGAIMGGCNDNNYPQRYLLMSNPNGTTLGNIIFNISGAPFSSPINNTRGLMMGNRISTTTVNAWKDGVKVLIDSSNGVTERPTINYYIGARNNELVASGFDNKETAFYSIGDGLSDTEASAFYTAVQKYQTTLGRQVGTPVLAEGQTAGLLETYSGAAAAYSLRKLRNSYYGNAIRVRRSSDNAEQDIAFDASGNLDTVSLLAFVGGGNGFVTTWYDQSGNGLHFAQSTAANQPSIVINSAVVLTLGEPSVRFNSVNKNYLEIPSSTSSFNFLHNGTDSTVISVGRYNFVTDPRTDSTLISNGGGGSGTVGTWIGFSDTSPLNNSFGVIVTRGVVGIGDNATHTAVSMVSDTALPYTKQNLHFVNINAGAAAIERIKVQYDNNTIAKNNIRSNTPSTANATNNMMMGVYIQGGVKYQSLEGDVQELIIYNSNQDTNRTGIKTNINSFYSIY